MTQEADRSPAQPSAGQRRTTGRPGRKPQGRPSLGGGAPAQDRELRAQGRETVRKLLDAGTIEFEERGFNGVRVDDVVRRAGISHGTFYLYFSNKEDLFKALLRDALHDMESVAGDFPVVTGDETGLAVLRQWVRKFFAAYAAHSTVLRTLSSANAPGELFGDGLRPGSGDRRKSSRRSIRLFRIARRGMCNRRVFIRLSPPTGDEHRG